MHGDIKSKTSRSRYIRGHIGICACSSSGAIITPVNKMITGIGHCRHQRAVGTGSNRLRKISRYCAATSRSIIQRIWKSSVSLNIDLIMNTIGFDIIDKV